MGDRPVCACGKPMVFALWRLPKPAEWWCHPAFGGCGKRLDTTPIPVKLPPDPVNSPPHYTAHPRGIECIDVVEHMPLCRGSAIQYIWRAGLKGDAETELEDLRKARWYIDREIQRLERSRG